MNRPSSARHLWPLLAGPALVGWTVPAGAAQGVIDLTWGDMCAPVVSTTTVVPGQNNVSLIVSVLGNNTMHRGYLIQFMLSDPSGHVPDAWRFDPPGCQGSESIFIQHLATATASPTCPNFMPSAENLQIKEYNFMPPALGLPVTAMRGFLVNVYPSGVLASANVRYFLGRFLFNHSSSVVGPGTPGVTCGGVETPMTVRLLDGECRYIIVGSDEEFRFLPGNMVVGANGAVPAGNVTWGQIKSTYRR